MAVYRIEYSTGRLRAARAAIRHLFDARGWDSFTRDEGAKAVAALLVVAELVVRGAGRREQHHLAGLGGRAGGRDGALEVAAAVQRDAGVGSRSAASRSAASPIR